MDHTSSRTACPYVLCIAGALFLGSASANQTETLNLGAPSVGLRAQSSTHSSINIANNVMGVPRRQRLLRETRSLFACIKHGNAGCVAELLQNGRGDGMDDHCNWQVPPPQPPDSEVMKEWRISDMTEMKDAAARTIEKLEALAGTPMDIALEYAHPETLKVVLAHMNRTGCKLDDTAINSFGVSVSTLTGCSQCVDTIREYGFWSYDILHLAACLAFVMAFGVLLCTAHSGTLPGWNDDTSLLAFVMIYNLVIIYACAALNSKFDIRILFVPLKIDHFNVVLQLGTTTFLCCITLSWQLFREYGKVGEQLVEEEVGEHALEPTDVFEDPTSSRTLCFVTFFAQSILTGMYFGSMMSKEFSMSYSRFLFWLLSMPLQFLLIKQIGVSGGHAEQASSLKPNFWKLCYSFVEPAVALDLATPFKKWELLLIVTQLLGMLKCIMHLYKIERPPQQLKDLSRYFGAILPAFVALFSTYLRNMLIIKFIYLVDVNEGAIPSGKEYNTYDNAMVLACTMGSVLLTVTGLFFANRATQEECLTPFFKWFSMVPKLSGTTVKAMFLRCGACDTKVRLALSFVSNGLYSAIIIWTLPIFLLSSETELDFVKDAFAVTFIIAIDNELARERILFKVRRTISPSTRSGSRDVHIGTNYEMLIVDGA